MIDFANTADRKVKTRKDIDGYHFIHYLLRVKRVDYDEVTWEPMTMVTKGNHATVFPGNIENAQRCMKHNTDYGRHPLTPLWKG